MDSARVKSLLDEADTLGTYVANAGKLPEDSRIFELIDSMRLALERGEQPLLAPLFAERNKVSSAAGITVAQLMRRETPVGRFRHGVALVASFLIGFMTLLLTLYLAFQSSELHKADLALREYQDLVSERLPDKIYLAWKMYYFEDVLNVKGPPLAQLDGYQKLIDDAKRLHSKRTAVNTLLLDSSIIRYIPEQFRPAASEVQKKGTDYTQGKIACLEVDLPPVFVAKRPPVSETMQAPLVSRLDLKEYVRQGTCFMQSLGMVSHDYPADPMIYATRNKVHLLVSWLLPGLYGLLGACVFVMRDLLRDNMLSRVHGDARIVDLLSLVLRIALGGLAGIIIGWFSVPTSLTASSAAISISSIPFGMAFLAGFSIESLFALLDRLNKPQMQRPEKKPAEVATEPEMKR